MLVLFAFSITPKKWLHDWVANHKDTAGKFFVHHSNTQVGKAGYNCHADDLVVESPFIETDLPAQLSVSPVFIFRFVEDPGDFHSANLFFFSLRGPPAIA
jgi:hypothetical protein